MGHSGYILFGLGLGLMNADCWDQKRRQYWAHSWLPGQLLQLLVPDVLEVLGIGMGCGDS